MIEKMSNEDMKSQLHKFIDRIFSEENIIIDVVLNQEADTKPDPTNEYMASHIYSGRRMLQLNIVYDCIKDKESYDEKRNQFCSEYGVPPEMLGR